MNFGFLAWFSGLGIRVLGLFRFSIWDGGGAVKDLGIKARRCTPIASLDCSSFPGLPYSRILNT